MGTTKDKIKILANQPISEMLTIDKEGEMQLIPAIEHIDLTLSDCLNQVLFSFFDIFEIFYS